MQLIALNLQKRLSQIENERIFPLKFNKNKKCFQKTQ